MQVYGFLFFVFVKQGKEKKMALEETIIQLKHMGKEFKTANGPVKALDDICLLYTSDAADEL